MSELTGCFSLFIIMCIVFVLVALLFSSPLIGIPLCIIFGFLVRAFILDYQRAQKYMRDNPGQARNYISLDPLNRTVIVPIIVVVEQSNQNPSVSERGSDNSNPNLPESNGGAGEPGRDQNA